MVCTYGHVRCHTNRLVCSPVIILRDMFTVIRTMDSKSLVDSTVHIALVSGGRD